MLGALLASDFWIFRTYKVTQGCFGPWWVAKIGSFSVLFHQLAFLFFSHEVSNKNGWLDAFLPIDPRVYPWLKPKLSQSLREYPRMAENLWFQWFFPFFGQICVPASAPCYTFGVPLGWGGPGGRPPATHPGAASYRRGSSWWRDWRPQTVRLTAKTTTMAAVSRSFDCEIMHQDGLHRIRWNMVLFYHPWIFSGLILIWNWFGPMYVYWWWWITIMML